MSVVHLVRQGAQAHLAQGRLEVRAQDEVLLRVPLGQVRAVVVWGNVGLTTPLLTALADRDIAVTFMTRQGRFRARLEGPTPPHVSLRRLQYAATRDASWLTRTARGLVRSKVQHQRALLRRYARLRLAEPTALTQPLAALQRALQALPAKTSVGALRGVEGAAARAYFRALRILFRPRCVFSGRRRRPPPDPVNALLSLGYTLLIQRAYAAAQAVGLDPYAGFLHSEVYGRPALALDLAEEFRPVVDGVVLRVCNQGQLAPDDFEADSERGGLRLKSQALRVFLQALETRFAQKFRPPRFAERRPLSQWLVEQAYQVARRLRENRPGFKGLGFRG